MYFVAVYGDNGVMLYSATVSPEDLPAALTTAREALLRYAPNIAANSQLTKLEMRRLI